MLEILGRDVLGVILGMLDLPDLLALGQCSKYLFQLVEQVEIIKAVHCSIRNGRFFEPWKTFWPLQYRIGYKHRCTSWAIIGVKYSQRQDTIYMTVGEEQILLAKNTQTAYLTTALPVSTFPFTSIGFSGQNYVCIAIEELNYRRMTEIDILAGKITSNKSIFYPIVIYSDNSSVWASIYGGSVTIRRLPPDNELSTRFIKFREAYIRKVSI